MYIKHRLKKRNIKLEYFKNIIYYMNTKCLRDNRVKNCRNNFKMIKQYEFKDCEAEPHKTMHTIMYTINRK